MTKLVYFNIDDMMTYLNTCTHNTFMYGQFWLRRMNDVWVQLWLQNMILGPILGHSFWEEGIFTKWTRRGHTKMGQANFAGGISHA